MVSCGLNLAGHGGDGNAAAQLDLVEVGDAHAEVVGVAQQAQLERFEAHRLGDDGVGGEDVGAGRGDAEVEPVAVAGAAALHAACAVDHGDVRGHEAGQPDQVDVHGARFIGGAALAVAVEAVHLDAVLAVDGAHDHILEREGDDAGVVRFGNGDRDGAGAVEDGAGHAHDRLAAVSQHDRGRLPCRLAVQVEQAQGDGVLLFESVVAEVAVGVPGVCGAGLGDEDLARRRGRGDQEVEDAAQGVDMAGGELVVAAEEVRFEHDLVGEAGFDIGAHQFECVEDVGAAVAAVDEADSCFGHGGLLAECQR